MIAELEYQSAGRHKPVLRLTRETQGRRATMDLNITNEQARAIEVGLGRDLMR